MKSKFRFWPRFLLLMFLFMSLSILAFMFIYFDRFLAYGKPFHFLSFPYTTLNFIILALIGSQLKYSAQKIIIKDNSITRIRNFGVGLKKVYKINEIAGFLTYTTSGKKNAHEYLYLIAKDENIAKLSTCYHKNYHELKSYLIQHQVQNLGHERWTKWKHFTEKTD